MCAYIHTYVRTYIHNVVCLIEYILYEILPKQGKIAKLFLMCAVVK